MDPLIRVAASICVQDSTWPWWFEDCIGYVQMSHSSQVKLLFIQWYCQRMMKGCPTPLKRIVWCWFRYHSQKGGWIPTKLDPFRQIFCWVSEIRKAWRDESSIISFLRGMARTVGRPSPPLHLEPVLPRKLHEWKPTNGRLDGKMRKSSSKRVKISGSKFQAFFFRSLFCSNPDSVETCHLVEILYFGHILHWTKRVSRFQLKKFPRSFQDVPGTKFLAPIFHGMSSRQQLIIPWIFWEMIQMFDLWKVGKRGGTNHRSADSKTPRGHPNWESSTKSQPCTESWAPTLSNVEIIVSNTPCFPTKLSPTHWWMIWYVFLCCLMFPCFLIPF